MYFGVYFGDDGCVDPLLVSGAGQDGLHMLSETVIIKIFVSLRLPDIEVVLLILIVSAQAQLVFCASLFVFVLICVLAFCAR